MPGSPLPPKIQGRILPGDLVSDDFAAKVLPLFRRGDYDIAVFQAFKEVEVATRKAADAKDAGYPDDCVGRDLMQKAFNAENGPLTNSELTPGQRQAEMFLFSGAMGHARNPAGHTDFEVTAVEAARLVIFASHLCGARPNLYHRRKPSRRCRRTLPSSSSGTRLRR